MPVGLSSLGRGVMLVVNNASAETATPEPASGAQDEGLANFRHISITKTSTPPLSLVDVAPGLLPFFNNAPVFGLPGTVEGNFWHRTQLLGDLNGHRTDLARHGIFIDMYSTSAYQSDLRRPENRQRVCPKYAALSKCGHRTRRALAWRIVPFHCAVSIWKLASKDFHGRLFRPSIYRIRPAWSSSMAGYPSL
jgi:hypothetical protein